ncbi:MAG TPA: peptidase S74, partial [Verrucomicrobiae bacterium]
LPITQWRFKDFPGALHLGPMAQDFRTSFGLGLDDVSIATVDADGVALAAIQGLNQKLEETRAENAELRKRLMELESRIESLREVGRQH